MATRKKDAAPVNGMYDTKAAGKILNITARRVRALCVTLNVGTRFAGDRILLSEADIRALRDRNPDWRLYNTGTKSGVRS